MPAMPLSRAAQAREDLYGFAHCKQRQQLHSAVMKPVSAAAHATCDSVAYQRTPSLAVCDEVCYPDMHGDDTAHRRRAAADEYTVSDEEVGEARRQGQQLTPKRQVSEGSIPLREGARGELVRRALHLLCKVVLPAIAAHFVSPAKPCFWPSRASLHRAVSFEARRRR